MEHCLPHLVAPEAPAAKPLYERLCRLWRDLSLRAVFVWQRQRQRRRLRSLDDRLLDDIGLTREQASKEGQKPFWR